MIRIDEDYIIKVDEIGLTDTVKQIHDGVYKQGFDDGIDKLVEMINEMPTYENESGEYMPMPIEIMAEQLKEQKNGKDVIQFVIFAKICRGLEWN